MRVLGALLFLAAVPLAAHAEPRLVLEVAHDGFDEYYCVTRGTLRNEGDAAIREVNGFFIIYQGDEVVGRARGASFLNLEPGGEADALFPAPNVPCDTADGFEFVVSACMMGNSFMDREDCAGLLRGEGAVKAVSAR
ncbi:MAG: hypothetical protein AAF748_15230 [Pseudomonadota bacterium]